jgi:hypothetical protein
MLRLAALPVLATLMALGGCSTSTGSCNDFAALPDPQARYDSAPIVVIATVRETDRTAQPDAVYRLHRARIESVVKGDLRQSAVDVYAPADQCFTDGRPAEYLDDDPLVGVGRSVLYLAKDRRTGVYSLWGTAALDPLPEGSPLPFSTSAPTPSPSPPVAR